MAAWFHHLANRPIPDNGWLTRQFPELRRIPDPKQRGDLGRAAYRTVSRWMLVFTAVFTLTAIALAILAAQMILRLLGAYVPISGDVIAGAGGGLAALLTTFAPVLLFRRKLRQAFREQLVSHGVAICLHCGYDLTGQTDPRCPECGTLFHPGLLKHENPGASHEQ